MHQTKSSAIMNNDRITVDIHHLQEMLGCGRKTADDIGTNAGAVIRFGKRKLYSVKKVEEYIASRLEV